MVDKNKGWDINYDPTDIGPSVLEDQLTAAEKKRLEEEEKKRKEEEAKKLAEESAKKIESEPEPEPEPEDDEEKKDLFTAIKRATSAEALLKDVYQSDVYEEGMEDLAGELAAGEEALSAEYSTEKDALSFAAQINQGINLAAQLLATSQGVKRALSEPLDFGERKRIAELKDEIDNKRRMLRSRISSAKSTLHTTLGKEEAQRMLEYRSAQAADTDADRESLRKIKTEEVGEDKKQAKEDNKARMDYDAREKYDTNVKSKQDKYRAEVYAAKEKDRIKALMKLGKSEDEAKKLLGIRFGIDNDPDKKAIEALIKEKAEERTPLYAPRIKGEQESGTTQPPVSKPVPEGYIKLKSGRIVKA
jgi:hypothetical protein